MCAGLCGVEERLSWATEVLRQSGQLGEARVGLVYGVSSSLQSAPLHCLLMGDLSCAGYGQWNHDEEEPMPASGERKDLEALGATLLFTDCLPCTTVAFLR